jgi:magnesium transporter
VNLGKKWVAKGVIIMEKDFNGWKWTTVKEEEFKALLPSRLDYNLWFGGQALKSKHFSFVEEGKAEDSCIIGSLPIAFKEGFKVVALHFVLTKKQVVSIENSDGIVEFLTHSVKKDLMAVSDAVEGFMVLIRHSLSNYLMELYPTIKHLKVLHERMQNDTAKNHFSQIMDFEHKLIKWKNTLLPIDDLFFTFQEYGGDDVKKNENYQKAKAKIERIKMLIDEQNGINNRLLGLDDKEVQYKGNEIMKTLTVFTVLATPMTAFGALWGMNFKQMPELNEKYGYLFALLAIIISSVLIYIWLRKKGWTKNILDNKKNT